MNSPYKYIFSLIWITYISFAIGATNSFNQLAGKWTYYYSNYITGSLFNGTWIQNILFNIFLVLAGFLFSIALIVAFFSAIRLFVSSNNEEDFSKWSKSLVWSIAWLLLVTLSYGFIVTMRNVLWSWSGAVLSVTTLYNATVWIVYPLLNFIRYIAAICFFIVLIYAFYRIIFSGWDEEGFQKGKQTFIIATLGFIIMLLAEPIVKMAYGWSDCFITVWWTIPKNCIDRTFDTNIFFDTAVKIIIFLNGFIGLITVIMIIYAWFLIMVGWWDEEKSEKAKKIISYAIIWVLIILFSYVIYRAILFNIS